MISKGSPKRMVLSVSKQIAVRKLKENLFGEFQNVGAVIEMALLFVVSNIPYNPE